MEAIQTLKSYLGSLEIGPPISHQNLTLFPVTDGQSKDLTYLLLEEAMATGKFQITELGFGTVPQLRLVNRTGRIVFLMDGEALVGAKQNRTLNTSILAAAKSNFDIPVSCVEQGRWSYDTPTFRSEKRMMNADLRAMKAGHVHASLTRKRGFRSDQGALWDEIADMSQRRQAYSPSGAMSAIHDEDRSLVQDYEKAFHPVPGQIGALFFLNGRTAGLDAFGRQETLVRVFSKLLRSYALDAVDRYDPAGSPPLPEIEAQAFVEACAKARVEVFPAVGLGQDGRLSSLRIVGFALALEGQLFHLSAFSRSGAGDHSRTRMNRFTQRLNHAERI